MPYDTDTGIGGGQHRFPSTRRTLLASATLSHGGISREALDSIIAIYWKPVYKYVRLKWKRGNEEAKDLVQAFFMLLLEDNIVEKFDPEKALFRTYLRGCVDNFVMKHDEASRRLKRGGGVRFEPLDFDLAEREIAANSAASSSMEDYFHREWQRTIFALAIDDLRRFCIDTGREKQFAIFEAYDLASADRPTYDQLAATHNIAATDVTNYLAWARRSLKRSVLDRIASVSSGSRECRSEARRLLG